jgi:hypothetical protein
VQLIDNQDGWVPILIIRGTISKADADYVTQQSEGKYKNKSLTGRSQPVDATLYLKRKRWSVW